MSIIILDLDNCIADDAWRIDKIDWLTEDPWKRYHEYHLLAGFDKVGNEDLFKDTQHDIVIFTARPEMYRGITMQWLSANGIKPAVLKMRPNNDHAHSKALKQRFLIELLEELSMTASSVACAYDDRPDVVEMYKALGVNAELRDIHTNCAYTKPINKSGAGSQPVRDGLFSATSSLWCSSDNLEIDGSTEFQRSAPYDQTIAKVSQAAREQMAFNAAQAPTESHQEAKNEAATSNPADILMSMAETLRARNAIYCDNYKMVGKMMGVLFPHGVSKELLHSDQFHLFELILVKLSRYAVSGLTHKDSIHDTGVYAAFCEAINTNQESQS